MPREKQQVSRDPQSETCQIRSSRVARDDNPDLDIPMNAAPKENEQTIPDTLTKYFTLDKNRNPVGVSLECRALVSSTDPSTLQGEFYGQTDEHEESEWEVKDYLDS